MIAQKFTMYGGQQPSVSALECNGQEVSRETYNALFQCIGTSFGSGDGSTTFNLPDETPYPANIKIYIGVF